MRYFLSQTWSNIRESWGVVLQAVLMMTIAFFVVGAFALLAIQVEAILARWESEAPVLAYLDTSLDADARAQLRKQIHAWPTTRRVRLVSPQESMKRLRRSMGKHKKLLKGLDGPLLPPTLEIDVLPQARTDAHLQKLETALRQMKGIKAVDVGQKWFAPLWTLVRWIRGILWGGGSLLLLCACFIAAGTIRMALYVHRYEIEVMRLLGATEGFIRVPFYVEGGLQGLLAVSTALGLLFALFWGISSQYDQDFLSFTTLHLRFFHWGQILGGAVIGMVTGLLGSWIALAFSHPEQGTQG